MSRTILGACAIFAVALSITFAGNAEAQNCDVPPGPVGIAAWAWGSNYFGQLGDGATGASRPAMPVHTQKLNTVTAIAGGGSHTLVVQGAATVWASGRNASGKLGDGTTIDRSLPVQVHNLHGIKAIEASDHHSVAVNDGTVWAWGDNAWGELGDGTTVDRLVPVEVQNLSGVTAVAAGASGFTFAVKNDGTVWAWGGNSGAQLGDGTTINRLLPVPVQNLSGVTAVAAGAWHGLALRNDGTVWAWGNNNYGQLGDGTSGTLRSTPVQVQNLGGVKAIAAGGDHSLAVINDGTVLAWGRNNFGQLGDGTTIDRALPVPVQNLSGITSVAAGYGHSLALNSACMVLAWGLNDVAQLGDATTINRLLPVPVQASSGVRAIAAGGWFSLAIAPVLLSHLTVVKFLVHPDHNHLRLFNLMIDGVVVRADVNSGSTEPQLLSPGNHTVSETGGTGTPLFQFTTVFGGDCAADGTVNLAPGDQKICTITNYDRWGGCPAGRRCCEPGENMQACQRCYQICP